MWNDQLLAARRLVEAGVRCVTVAYGFWDTHSNNFGWLRRHASVVTRKFRAKDREGFFARIEER